jgi:hypothetical protein
MNPDIDLDSFIAYHWCLYRAYPQYDRYGMGTLEIEVKKNRNGFEAGSGERPSTVTESIIRLGS